MNNGGVSKVEFGMRCPQHRKLGRIARAAAMLAAAVATNALAQGSAAEAPTQVLVVTGSNFRFAGLEAAGPVQVITRQDIQRSGRTLSDLLRSISADNSGSLSQAFSGSFAGGASGLSLRGLSVNATLVLIDGRRTALYPLGDDAQRQFVDLSSLPLEIVERVEILKAGASPVYGSDAIAGVVNIVLRRDFKGAGGSALLGLTTRGDGASGALAASWGFGDLSADGRNTYLHVELRQQRAIRQDRRAGDWSSQNLSDRGGPDLRGGVVQPGSTAPANYAQTLVGMVAPLDADRVQVGPFQLLPGCAPADRNASGGCSWDPLRYAQVQPETRNLNLLGRHTESLAGGWRARIDLQASVSWADQLFFPTYVPQPTQTDPATSNVILPASHPDNPFGPAQAALLYYTFGDLGARHTKFRTTLLRGVGLLEGDLAGWDVEASLGLARASTHASYHGMVRTSALAALLASGRYRIGANASRNDASVYALLSPESAMTATSTLSFADLRASRRLMQLGGGPLVAGLGLETRRQRVDNPGQPGALEGDVLGNATTAARGGRSAHSFYAGLQVPFVRGASLDLALRHERHVGLASSTAPGASLRFELMPGLTARATQSRGFRVPGLLEAGNSTFNAYTNFNDEARCPTTQLPSDCNSTIRLALSGNPALKPETSRSTSVGLLFAPGADTRIAVDHYRIRRRNEIAFAPFSAAETIYGGPDLAHPNLPRPIVGFILPFINANATRTSGWDLELRHRQRLGAWGRLSGQLAYTRIDTFETEIDGTRYEFAGTHGPTSLSGNVGTPKHRAQAGLVWERGAIEVGTQVNYVHSMRATDPTIGDACLAAEANPRCRIASFTSVDLSGRWQIAPNLALTASLRNLFDRAPPLDTVTYGGVLYNPSLHQAGGVGRSVFVGLRYGAR